MNGREVFRFATQGYATGNQEVLGKAGFKLADIQWIVPHQANLRIIEAAAKGLKFPMEKIVVNIERYGNTSPASIPLATVEAIEDSGIEPGTGSYSSDQSRAHLGRPGGNLERSLPRSPQKIPPADSAFPGTPALCTCCAYCGASMRWFGGTNSGISR